jgi:hypothetical protein
MRTHFAVADGRNFSCTQHRLERLSIMGERDLVSKVFFSSSPMAVAWNIHVVRYSLLVVYISFLAIGSWTVNCIIRMGLPHFPHYRFTALELRNGGNITSPGIKTFGLLVEERGGHTVNCKARLLNATFIESGASLTLSLPSEYDPSMNQRRTTGWYFVTADGSRPPELDPVGVCKAEDIACTFSATISLTFLLFFPPGCARYDSFWRAPMI